MLRAFLENQFQIRKKKLILRQTTILEFLLHMVFQFFLFKQFFTMIYRSELLSILDGCQTWLVNQKINYNKLFFRLFSQTDTFMGDFSSWVLTLVGNLMLSTSLTFFLFWLY